MLAVGAGTGTVRLNLGVAGVRHSDVIERNARLPAIMIEQDASIRSVRRNVNVSATRAPARTVAIVTKAECIAAVTTARGDVNLAGDDIGCKIENDRAAGASTSGTSVHRRLAPGTVGTNEWHVASRRSADNPVCTDND